MKLISFFIPKIVVKKTSKFNKNIEVRDFLGRRSLRVNNLTQSGSIVEDIYKKIIPIVFCHSRPDVASGKNLASPRCSIGVTPPGGNLYNSYHIDSRVPTTSLRVNKPENDSMLNVLILGFGTGTFAKLIKNRYPRVQITGIEIDQVIIDLGKKYFETGSIKNLKIINTDAVKFINSYYDTSSYHSKFEIIFVDLYKGEQIEPSIENKEFLFRLRKFVTQNGTIVFNRLNFSVHKKEAEMFKEKLGEIFSQVTFKKSYSNIIFLCKK